MMDDGQVPRVGAYGWQGNRRGFENPFGFSGRSSWLTACMRACGGRQLM